jgi:hypothetical protein
MVHGRTMIESAEGGQSDFSAEACLRAKAESVPATAQFCCGGHGASAFARPTDR